MGLKEEMSNGFWSEEDDDHLRKLALSGLSLAAIAAQLKRSKSAVRVRAIKLDVAIARDRNPMQNPINTSAGQSEIGLRAKK